ncbi:MAG: hypothetical protein ACLU9S_19625 [Oscillospiraceae bacterium]
MKINPADYSIEVQKLCNYTLRDMEFDYTTGTMYAIASGGTVCERSGTGRYRRPVTARGSGGGLWRPLLGCRDN